LRKIRRSLQVTAWSVGQRKREKMNKLKMLLAGGLLALMVPGAALAQINISATVVAACTFGSATVTLNGAGIAAGTLVTDTSTTVNLTCNKGATVSVALNDGANGSGSQKRLRAASTTNYINYNLSRPNTLVDGGTNTCPSLPATEWNATNTVTATRLFATTGGPKPIPICISVPASQFPQAGTYTDTVTATLTVS
jgi:spore coat protein U-like protein